jgi:bacillolysin/neutral peptidase B
MVEPPADENVARAYLDAMLSEHGAELKGLISEESPKTDSDLLLMEVKASPHIPTRVVKFVQTCKSLPIFGTAAYVELNSQDQRLVSTDATLTDAPDVSATPELDIEHAIKAIESYAGMALPVQTEKLADAELKFFCDTKYERWRLVYHFKDVPLVPPEQRGEQKAGHGLGPSPRDNFRIYDYFVDAHSGEVVFYFSAQPRLDSSDVPVRCMGVDEFGQLRDFEGSEVDSTFLLADPSRNIETFDYAWKDVMQESLPDSPISHSSPDFGETSRAGVSAHYHAKQVFDFFNNVLKRKGIDDHGMKLICLVNVTYPDWQTPPDWRNAVWWKNRMWFGQSRNHNGGFDSFARHFDIIAHELCHGVTQTTANLTYRDESGALNESFSDIFGIIVKNWYPGQPEPLDKWDWTIGAGLGLNGAPLRDLSNPRRSAQPQPDHMKDYVVTAGDDGGVHINSGIHNKAAHNLLVATDTSGRVLFPAAEVAVLYYLTLRKLSELSTFSDCLRILKEVIPVRNSIDSPQLLAAKQKAVVGAYTAVGIM